MTIRERYNSMRQILPMFEGMFLGAWEPGEYNVWFPSRYYAAAFKNNVPDIASVTLIRGSHYAIVTIK